jgi:tetratricopeptide (TPR) repeat protein
MKLEIIKCPSCGASLTVTKDMDIVNCAYCDNAVRIRDSLVIKNDQNIKNYLDIAYNAIKVRNFDDAMPYINKVLEIDIDNLKALWGKAVISISDSGGDLIRMREGLTYSLKAYGLGNEDEKKEIKEKMISEITNNKLLFMHTEYLLEIFNAFGADDKRLLLYIIEISEECYFNAVANGNDNSIFEYDEMNDKILGLLWKIDKAGYEKTVKQQKTKYEAALEERKIFLNALKDELYKNSFSQNIFFSITIIFFLSLAFITPAPKGSAGVVFLTMFIIFFLAYLWILNLHIKDKVKNYEKKRYLSNKIY